MSGRVDNVASAVSAVTTASFLADLRYSLPETNGGANVSRNFTIVKSSNGFAGFSSTSHYRISQLASDLDVGKDSLDDNISTETYNRGTALSGLRTDLEGSVDNLSTSLSTSVSTLTVDASTVSNALSTEISTRSINNSTLNTRADGLSTAISEAFSSEASARNSVDASLDQEIIDETGARGTQYTFISQTLSTSISTLSDAISANVAEMDTLGGELSDAISDNYELLSGFIDDEAISRATAVSNLSTLVSSDFADLSDALSTEVSSRISTVNVLSADIVTAQNSLETDISAVSALLNYTISNVDPASIDSLTEIIAAYESADQSLVGSINNLITAELDNNKAHDERLDYLERFCVMMSDFLHIVHVDEASAATLVAFPPTNDDSAIYNDISISYDTSNIYTNYITNGYSALTQL